MAVDTGKYERPLVIACGAIAHELVAVLGKNAFERNIDVRCLPAEWHNTPERIAPAVEAILNDIDTSQRSCFVAYGDCGSGGALDRVIADYGVERLPGAHCYAFFTGIERFDRLAEQEIGTLWLTDFLALNFERLIMQGLGIVEHPELRDIYFQHYRRVVWLVQHHSEVTEQSAIHAAASLDLPLHIESDCMSPFSDILQQRVIPLLPQGIESI